MNMMLKIFKSRFKPLNVFNNLPRIPSDRGHMIFFRRLWDNLYKPATVSRFKTIFFAFLALGGLEVLLGFSLLFAMNRQLVHVYQGYYKKVGIISEMQNKLNTHISERISGKEVHDKSLFAMKRTAYLLSDIQYPQVIRKLKRSIVKLNLSLNEPVINDYKITSEAKRAKGYLNQYQRQLDIQTRKSAKTIYRNTWIFELLLLGIILAGVALLLKIMLREGENHQKAIKHFNNVAEKLGNGEINPGILPYKTVELEALQVALKDYLQRFSERYSNILNKIDEFTPLIYQLGQWIKKNDAQHVSIKQNLEDLANKIYQKLAQFPDLSGQIQEINKDFVVSQAEAADLQSAIQGSRDLLSAGSDQIKTYHTRSSQKGQYFQKIACYLKELKALLDEIQTTVTSFYSIAEQTNLLSLNASIEAARAGEAGDNFSIAALEIEELASKISKASKELLTLSVAMGKKTTTVIRSLEFLMNFNKSESKYLDDIHEQIQGFILRVTDDFEKIEGYGALINQYEAEEQTLENIAAVLSRLKAQSPVSRGKAAAALEVIVESDKLITSVDELADNLSELRRNLAQIRHQSNLEEQS